MVKSVSEQIYLLLPKEQHWIDFLIKKKNEIKK